MSRRTPSDVIEALGHARIERAPKRARDIGSAFWSARALPDLTKLPKLVRLTMYRAIGEAELPELFERVSASSTLEDLALVGCDIAALPDDLSRLRRLASLHVEQAELSTLPASIGRLAQLEELWIRACPVRELPASLGELTSLEALRILAAPYAPGSLRRMPALDRAASLAHVGLGYLPELEDAAFLTRLPALRSVELAGRVTARGVPEALSLLTELRALALRDTAELPRAVAGMRALQTLYFVESSCARLPDWLPELTSLRYLALHGDRTLEPSSIVDVATHMPGLVRLFLPYPFEAASRDRLKAIGFVTNRTSPSVMSRGADDVVDPFPFVR